MMRNGTHATVPCILAALGLVMVAGCGEKAAEKAMETAVTAQGGSADVDIEGESMQITAKDEDGKTMTMNVDGDNAAFTANDGAVSVNVGENVELPAGMPKDVPLYPGMRVVTSIEDTSENAVNISATTEDSIDKVTQYYKKEAAAHGWTEQMAQSMGEMQMLNYTKAGRLLNVMVVAADGQTGIQLTISSE